MKALRDVLRLQADLRERYGELRDLTAELLKVEPEDTGQLLRTLERRGEVIAEIDALLRELEALRGRWPSQKNPTRLGDMMSLGEEILAMDREVRHRLESALQGLKERRKRLGLGRRGLAALRATFHPAGAKVLDRRV